MARLAIFRSMHNVRPGERHLPSRSLELAPPAVAYLGLCEVELGNAWATDRLTDIRRRMESEAKLLESYAIDAERKAGAVDLRASVTARLSADHRWNAVQQFLELAREAENAAMTLVYDEP